MRLPRVTGWLTVNRFEPRVVSDPLPGRPFASMPEYPSRRCQVAYDDVVPLPYQPSAVVLMPLAARARCTSVVDALSLSPARCPHLGSTWAAARTRAMSTLGRAAGPGR